MSSATAYIRVTSLFVGMVVFALLATGCSSVESMLKSIDKPTAKVRGVKLTDLSLHQATLAFDVEVSNPYGVDLPLVGLDYALASRDTSFLNGKADLSGSIPARGSRNVTLPATVTFTKLIDALKGVRPGQVVPYAADLGVSVKAPAAGELRLPLRKEGELPVPAVPKVEVTDIKWSKLDLTDASGVVTLRIENTNSFGVDLSSLAYQLSLGGSKVADAKIDKAIAFQPGKAQTVEVPINIAPIKLGAAAFQMLTSKSAAYDLSGSIAGKTPFGPVELPFSRKGETSLRK